jgi:hypothetical protein
VKTSCSHAAHNGALSWLVQLRDDPTNQNPDPSRDFGYGTLYQATAGANGATTLVRLSGFDFANRGVGLLAISGTVSWTFDDAYISFVVVDCTGATPVQKIVRHPAANLATNGGPMIDETNVETVMVSPYINEELEHSWSPDGTLLAYRLPRFNPDGTNYQQLILREVATGAERVLVDGSVSGIGVDGILEYAPDGTRIACTGNNNVYTVAVATGALKVVAAGGTNKNGTTYRYFGGAWSPDSGAIAIGQVTGSDWKGWSYYLEKVPSPGGTITNLTPGTLPSRSRRPGADLRLTWTPPAPCPISVL